jgi:hypothetical protein
MKSNRNRQVIQKSPAGRYPSTAKLLAASVKRTDFIGSV